MILEVSNLGDSVIFFFFSPVQVVRVVPLVLISEKVCEVIQNKATVIGGIMQLFSPGWIH